MSSLHARMPPGLAPLDLDAGASTLPTSASTSASASGAVATPMSAAASLVAAESPVLAERVAFSSGLPVSLFPQLAVALARLPDAERDVREMVRLQALEGDAEHHPHAWCAELKPGDDVEVLYRSFWQRAVFIGKSRW
jgi:hypothetical protein